MNGKTYGNIIDYTLKHLPEEAKENSVKTVTEIFKNMGVALPKGNSQDILSAMTDNNYMGWVSQKPEDAYNAAKNGIATVGISEDRIFIIISDTKSEEDEVLTNLASEDIIMLLDEDMSKNDLTGIQLFSNIDSTTGGDSSSISFAHTILTVKVGWMGYNSIKGSCPKPLAWSSGNTTVASVDPTTGLITAKGVGTTYIKAIASNGQSAMCIISVNKLLIYQSPQTFRNTQYGTLAEDLKYNDILEIDLKREFDYFSQKFNGYWEKPELFYREMLSLSAVATQEPLTEVYYEMVDHFMGGSGSDYRNSVLTQKVKEHPSTQKYIIGINAAIQYALSKNSDKITNLEYDKTWKYNDTARSNHIIVKYFNEHNILQPSFSENADNFNGLGLCVHSLWGNMIEVTSFKKTSTGYSGRILITLYDHFGLEHDDLSTFPATAIDGFPAWYILQHNISYNGKYKPYVNIMEFEVPFDIPK